MDVVEQDVEAVERKARKRSVAESIAVKSGALVKCTEHSDVYLDKGDPEALKQAYRVAESLFTGSEDSVSLFKSKEELIDTIKAVVEETSEECYCCSKFKYD